MESEKLFFLSNNLINDEYINMISNKFFNFKNQRNHNDFLFKIIDIQDSDSLNNEILSYFNKTGYGLKNLINSPNSEFKSVIKQSIPEKNPIFYTERSLKIFQ